MMESDYNMEKNMESLLTDILFSTPKRIKIIVDFVKRSERLLQVFFWSYLFILKWKEDFLLRCKGF